MRSGVKALVAVGRGCGSSAWCMVQHRHAQFHAVAVAGPGAARHLGRGSGLPRQRHLHSRPRPRAARRRWLRAVGPVAAGQRRQYRRRVLFAAIVEDGRRRHHRYFALPRAARSRSSIPGGRSASGARRAMTSWCRTSRSRASHAVDQPSQGRTHARQCAQQSVRFIAPRAIAFSVSHMSAACLGIAESGLEFYLEGVRRRIALTSRQKVSGYPTQQVKVAEASAATRRRATDSCSAYATRRAGLATATSCRATSRGRSSARMPRSPDGWRPVPSSCCGTPVPAAASTATIRCRASIAT